MLTSKMLSAILVAGILCSNGYCKTIPHKRTTRDSDLARAIEILQQQRNRLQEEDFRRLEEESGIDLQALGLLDDELNENPLLLSESLPDQDLPIDVLQVESPIMQDDVQNVVETSNEELENIFDNAEPIVKIVKSEEIIEEEPQKLASDENDDRLSDDEYQALLRAVEKLQKHSGGNLKNNFEVLKNKRAPKDVVKVSKEELNDVFGESNNKLDDEESAVQDEPDVLKRSSPNSAKIEETLPLDDYWLLNNYLNYDDNRKKRFTQHQEPLQEEEVDEEELIDEEKANMLAEIQLLRTKVHLEDLENGALTEALNQATHSQLEGYVSPQEFKSLEKAIKIEEALQSLDPSDEQLAFIVQQIARSTLKRGEPDFKKKSKRMDMGDLDSDYPMYNGAKSKKRSSFQEMWNDYPEQHKQTIIPSKELLAYLDRNFAGISDIDAEETEDDDVNPNYVLPNNSEQTALSPYIADNQQAECPEVDMYSDGCAFADVYGLPIDNEARELCNRYQICYTCGASFGLDGHWCDTAYREIYSSLCEENECIIEAELFLRTMKLKQRFIKQQMCVDKCTAEYIGIV